MGQAVWAACQAGVIFFLSGRKDGISLVGSFTFALAIFSPICLLGSLNTRNLVAIGRASTVSLLRDVCIRAAVVVVAMLVTAIVLFLTEKFSQFTYLTLLLLMLRGADQLSDVSAGYYQKHGYIKRLMYSYCGRGLVSLLTLAVVCLVTSSLSAGIGIAAISTLAFVIWFDLLVPLRTLPAPSKLEQAEVAGEKKIGGAVKIFPFLDSVHANSLRLAVGGIFSTEVVGIFGIIQTTFAPIQIIVSALALSNLRKLADLSSSNDAGFKKLVYKLSGISFMFVVGFGLFWLLIDVRLLNMAFPFLNSLQIKELGVFFTLSMLLFGPAGFYAQAALIRRQDKVYGIAPLVGLATFCIFIVASKIGLFSVDFLIICLCFLFSNAIRAAMCLKAVFRSAS